MPTPSIDNLSLFKAVIKLRQIAPIEELEYRDVGECSTATTNMEVETVVYQSKRHSSRVPVKTVNVGKTLTLAVTLSEMAEENMEIILMAEREGSPPDSFLSIGLADEKRFAVRLIGTNRVGKAYQADMPDVSFTPNGDFSWLTDTDWTEGALQGQVNADQISGSFGTVREIVAGVEETVGSPAI